ncbi:MAG: type III-B CRISPR module-associated protein Cmr5 [bacterium]|nr:type III-B CRISPR module-associated protein Cmr5 [bacterium]
MANPTQQQTLQQKRAAHAWGCIEQITKKPEDFRKKYGSQVRGLPALIQSDGLGQALAFLKAKDKNKKESYYFVAYEHIASWAQDKESGLNAQGDFLEWLLKQSTTDYRRATAEVLAYLSWIKRFAEAKGWQDEE